MAIPVGSDCFAVTLRQWAGKEPAEYAEFRLAREKSRVLVSGLLRHSGVGPV